MIQKINIFIAAVPDLLNICDVTADTLGMQGYLSSPGYQSPYGSNTDCTVSITPPADMGVSVELQMIDLDLETDCSDRLTITDRSNNQVVTLCGGFAPTMQRFINTSAVDLRFVTSDHMFAPQKRGFVLAYKSKH